MDSKVIRIQGAREHNLCNLSLTIPKEKLIVITGLSGSGKSSLAFDTLYAEGQRRYVDSLSAYARQFLEVMQKPDVDTIEGLSPAISIEQKTTSKNPRSTVGTVTEIYDYLRLLFARIGVPYSPATGKPIRSQTVSQVVDQLMTFKPEARLYLLAPLVRGRKGEYRDLFQSLLKKGFARVQINGTLYDIDNVPALDKNRKHTISVVVDRVILKTGVENRLAEAVETAFNMSSGLFVAQNIKTKEEFLFSEKFACPVSGFTIAEIEPRLFSFNSPFGACTSCDGLGQRSVFDPLKIVPDPTKSVLEGAVAPWGSNFSFAHRQTLSQLIRFLGGNPAKPFQDLSQKVQDAILYGTGNTVVPILYAGRKSKQSFQGVVKALERQSDTQYQSTRTCDACNGARLKPEALSIKIDGCTIQDVTDFSIQKVSQWIDALTPKLPSKEQKIAERILKEISERLRFLNSVGLRYLTLSRSAGTLSGGESQRIRLASQIGSGLTGVLYVLDEPSIGLHQRDNSRLLQTLKQLRDIGNTVLVVEHDEEAIRNADHIIDMGPGAGIHGGKILAQGTLADIEAHPASITGKYLTKKRVIPLPKKRRQGNGKIITLNGATVHNLKDINVSFPLGKMICVTGVSGGGKSSLVIETLYKALCQKLYSSIAHPGAYRSIQGVEYIDKTIELDQSPIGRTPRSNPATYTGAFTPMREWFASLPEAKARGYAPGRFSFNVKGGRCEACQGDGVIKIEMHFLPDVYVTCDQCKGKRYNRETLDIHYHGKSIADVLDMTVEEGIQFFQPISAVRTKLETLAKVGLGYMHIGQQATTLSGGEAQRIKLSKELSRRSTGRTFYVLDEPTTGLHFEDVRKLLDVLHNLVDQGNTMIIIEHNLDVIKTADWIIDVGPEGGAEGGEIIAMGTPETIVRNKKSYTGVCLQPFLLSKLNLCLKN